MTVRVVGMISGTSFDAVDVAVADLTFDGDTVVLRTLGSRGVPYPPQLRATLAAALPPHTVTAQTVCVLDTRVGQLFADVAGDAIRDLAGEAADLVVSHGQTLYHWVEDGHVAGSLQLGQPAWIAERTGLPVVADVRSRDIAAGGHGAPLASTLDVMLLGRDGPRRAALNLGGIANLTVVGGGEPPVAFDVGPANALIDVAVEAASGGAQTFDADGGMAAAGSVDTSLLARLLDDPYYGQEPPRSTGKERFHLAYLEAQLAGRPIDADVVATVTALTAETVARECRRFEVSELVVSGGGVSNPTLMGMLAGRLPDVVRLRPSDELGIPADGKEAYLVALLGFLTVHGLPGTIPTCTGARHASILGAVVPGATGLPRPTESVRGQPARLHVEVGSPDRRLAPP